jgi:hypothetical protein
MKYGPTVSLNNPDTIHLLMTDEFTKGGMALIGLHLSPDGETSIAKGIPATPENIAAIYQINKHMRIYIKYRGPRRCGTPHLFEKRCNIIRCLLQVGELFCGIRIKPYYELGTISTSLRNY